MLKRLLGHLAGKMRLKKRLNWYLAKTNYVKSLHINEVKIRIPSIHGTACNASEPWMIDLLAKIFHERSGALLDVGVNVGQTLVKAKALDPHREYIGFEPNPVCFSYVLNLIKENSFKNCTLLPVGLFTHDGVLSLDFFSDDATDSSASLVGNFRPDHRICSSLFVPVFQFESLKKILGEKPVGIVKIDVEGTELEVAKSLLDLINRDKPIIIVEILPVYSEENAFRKNRQDELERIFADADYALFRVEKTSSGAFSGLRLVEKIGIHSDLTQCDYVVFPRVQLAELQMTSDAPANKTTARGKQLTDSTAIAWGDDVFSSESTCCQKFKSALPNWGRRTGQFKKTQ